MPILYIDRNSFVEILFLSTLRQGNSKWGPYDNGQPCTPISTHVTGTCLGAGSQVTAQCQYSLLPPQRSSAAPLQPLGLYKGSRTEAKLAEIPRFQDTWIPGPEMLWIRPPCWGAGSPLNQLTVNIPTNRPQG